jgi:hypothetical protein
MPPSDVLFIIATRIRVKVKVAIIQKRVIMKRFFKSNVSSKKERS